MKVDDDGIREADIVPFPRWTDFAMLDPEFSVLSEWDFEALHVEFDATDSIKSKAKKQYALTSIHIKASRRWEAHIGQLIVTFCMFTLGLGTFSQGLGDEELGDRLGYCVTLLLADVATLQLLFDNLPNIPYWTVFDFYIYACFVFLFGATIWSCFAGSFESLQGDADTFAFYAFLVVYFLSQIGFVVAAIVKGTQEQKKIWMTSSQLEKLYRKSKTARDRRAISIGWEEENLFLDRKNDEDKPSNIFIRGRKNGKWANENDPLAFGEHASSPSMSSANLAHSVSVSAHKPDQKKEYNQL